MNWMDDVLSGEKHFRRMDHEGSGEQQEHPEHTKT
jgi:hypothetical protein